MERLNTNVIQKLTKKKIKYNMQMEKRTTKNSVR